MKKSNPEAPISPTRSDYDFAGLPASRMFTNFLRWRLIPIGYLANGPTLRWLVSVWFRHRFGFALATLRIKHRKWFDRLVRLVVKMRGQGSKPAKRSTE